jgi:hypothetical protein
MRHCGHISGIVRTGKLHRTGCHTGNGHKTNMFPTILYHIFVDKGFLTYMSSCNNVHIPVAITDELEIEKGDLIEISINKISKSDAEKRYGYFSDYWL